MKRLDIFSSFIAALATCNVSAQENIKLIVGTYTDGTGKGICSFDFNQETGASSPLYTLAINNPSFLKITPNGRFIYAVSETNDKNAALNAISFDARSGAMKLLNSVPTMGEDPCYVDIKGHLAVTANYSGGSMSVFPINEDGTLQPVSQQFKGSAGGSDTARQNVPHIHCSRFMPEGKSILATDFSSERILRYTLEGGNKVRFAGVAGLLSRDSGPRHIAFGSNGSFVYVMSELSGVVSVFRNVKGKMTKIQEVACDTPEARGGADIHLSPNGAFLYASNRLKNDGITIFTVDKTNGKIKKAGYQPTRKHPRNFNITPNGKFLLCASRDENIIQVFKIDASSGLLTDTKQDIKVDQAVCVQFHPATKAR